MSTVVVCCSTTLMGKDTLSTGGREMAVASGRSGESSSSGASSNVDAGLNL